ncbi:MAG: sulfite exporter TauE/SafE family protein [Magnetococcales bacterium]|nr:sulfite exporter TauE/SafE family protein [Magnetococcales bacterium]
MHPSLPVTALANTFPTPVELWVTFMTALFASGHCIGMCGGMVTALGLATEPKGSLFPRPLTGITRHLIYGVSRLFTYLLIGGFSGWLGSLAPTMGRSPWLSALPLWLAGVAMIIMGLDTLGIGRLPLASGRLQRSINGMIGHVSWKKPLLLGVLTGLLPCGLHWAFQAQAFATGSVAGGLLIIAAFGLGTLPALMGLGWMMAILDQRAWQILQSLAALIVMAMGFLALTKGFHKAGLL